MVATTPTTPLQFFRAEFFKPLPDSERRRNPTAGKKAPTTPYAGRTTRTGCGCTSWWPATGFSRGGDVPMYHVNDHVYMKIRHMKISIIRFLDLSSFPRPRGRWFGNS